MKKSFTFYCISTFLIIALPLSSYGQIKDSGATHVDIGFGLKYKSGPQARGGHASSERNGIDEYTHLTGLGVVIGGELKDFPFRGLNTEAGLVFRFDDFDNVASPDQGPVFLFDIYAGINTPVHIPKIAENKPWKLGAGWYLTDATKKVVFSAWDPVNMVMIRQELSMDMPSFSLSLSVPIWKLELQYARLWSYGDYFFERTSQQGNPYFHHVTLKYQLHWIIKKDSLQLNNLESYNKGRFR